MTPEEIAAQSVEDTAERLLTFLHLCEDDNPKHRLYVPLASMDGAVPLALADAKRDDASKLMIPVNTGLPALWPIDLRTVHDANAGIDDLADQWPAGTLQFKRVRSIQTKEARQRGASIFSPFMVMDEVVCAKPDGTAKSAHAPMAMVGGKWQNAAPQAIAGAPKDCAIPVALGTALALRYEWSVWIGHASGPRIRFLTDPLGAREVFRLRDIPPGKTRRAALRHWVSEHARKRHPGMDNEARTWVRRHLRGATDFVWNGLRCRVQPDDYELEQMVTRAAAQEPRDG